MPSGARGTARRSRRRHSLCGRKGTPERAVEDCRDNPPAVDRAVGKYQAPAEELEHADDEQRRDQDGEVDDQLAALEQPLSVVVLGGLVQVPLHSDDTIQPGLVQEYVAVDGLSPPRAQLLLDLLIQVDFQQREVGGGPQRELLPPGRVKPSPRLLIAGPAPVELALRADEELLGLAPRGSLLVVGRIGKLEAELQFLDHLLQPRVGGSAGPVPARSLVVGRPGAVNARVGFHASTLPHLRGS